jgi:hypothetical protein
MVNVLSDMPKVSLGMVNITARHWEPVNMSREPVNTSCEHVNMDMDHVTMCLEHVTISWGTLTMFIKSLSVPMKMLTRTRGLITCLMRLCTYLRSLLTCIGSMLTCLGTLLPYIESLTPCLFRLFVCPGRLCEWFCGHLPYIGSINNVLGPSSCLVRLLALNQLLKYTTLIVSIDFVDLSYIGIDTTIASLSLFNRYKYVTNIWYTFYTPSIVPQPKNWRENKPCLVLSCLEEIPYLLLCAPSLIT